MTANARKALLLQGQYPPNQLTPYIMAKKSNRVLLKEAIERNSTQVASAYNAIKAEQESLRDVIIDTPLLGFGVDNGLRVSYGGILKQLHPNALYQLADKMNIPLRYVRWLAAGDEWANQLLVTNLSAITTNRPTRVLLREVGDMLKGVLSDRYRRLNTMMLLQAYMGASQEMGCELYNARYMGTKIGVDIIRPEVYTVEVEGEEDSFAFGARFRHSDFGDGAFELSAFLLRVICTNGLVGHRELRTIHGGAPLPLELELSAETYRLDSERMASLLRDGVRSLLSDRSIEREIARISNAASTPIDVAKELKVLPNVGTLSSKEAEALENIFISGDGLPKGSNNRWKFSQGISRLAQYADTYYRADQLEELASGYLPKAKEEEETMEVAVEIVNQ